MTLSMFQASVPVLTQGLQNLLHILEKAEDFAKQKNVDSTVIVNTRLAVDMYPLARQVQIATDLAKAGAARLAGIEIPSYADTESTFEELKARVAKTIAFVESITAQHVDGSDDKTITFKVRGNEMTFTGQSYLVYFVLPNFYFHITTTYSILRHVGADIGKADYLHNLL
jgi:hypothetical protein